MNIKYKIQRNLSLRKYYFKDKESFTTLIEDIETIIKEHKNNDEKEKHNHELLYFIEITNGFGKIFVKSLSELKDVINESNSVYKIKFVLQNEEVRFILVLMEFETLKQSSYIKIYGNSKVIISDIEKKIYDEISKYQNKLSFVYKEWFETIVFMPITLYLYLLIKLDYFKDSSMQFSLIDTIIIAPIVVLVFIIIKFIQSLYVPTFKIKTKESFIKKLEMYYLNKKNSFGFKLLVYLFPIVASALISLIIALLLQ